MFTLTSCSLLMNMLLFRTCLGRQLRPTSTSTGPPSRSGCRRPKSARQGKLWPVSTVSSPGRPLTDALRYLVEEKRHLRHQDVGVIVEQLNRRRADLPADHADDRLLLLAPHVRPQQAAVLERAEIDYLDLAGNAHLQAPGLFVHVEGRQPPKEPMPAPGRPQKGWIKTVMAILIRPELTNAPYRTLADQADVALGTLAGCMNDLTARGLLLDGKGGRKSG